MEAILLGLYSLVVWLVFIKFKLLPWTTPWKVTVAIIPVVGLTAMILLLNIGAPSSADVRVIKYVVPIVSQVKGRVIEVPADNNKPMKKGDVLFRIDPTPYEIEVRSIEAQIVSDEAKARSDRAKVAEADARLTDAVAGGKQVNERLNAATGQVTAIEASLELARKRLTQNRELAASGAGSKFDLEQSETRVKELTAQLGSARADEQSVREELAGQVGGDLASIAAVKAQVSTARAQLGVSQAQLEATRSRLDNARWELSQTVMRAPADGIPVNVQLRPGAFVAGVPFNEVMTFVEYDYQIYALYAQNELHQVEPGNEAEIALETHPGHIIKAHVDSILWAQGLGQLDASGNLPRTTIPMPPGRFPVKLVIGEKDKSMFLASGAHGHAAIYTERFVLIHLVRKVILRVGSYTDYLILKLH
jgi:multidrug resistance efflux pump